MNITIPPLNLRRLLTAALLSAGCLLAASLSHAEMTGSRTVASGISTRADLNEITDIFSNAAACVVADYLRADMPVLPLYASNNGSCTAVDMTTVADGDYFSNAACTSPVSFEGTSIQTYCDSALNTETLGDAISIVDIPQPWTLSPGTMLDIGISSTENKTQPYSTRAAYKSETTAGGECALEMRVYKNDLAASDLKPMLAIHGGSWRYRSSFIGIESQVAHLTEQGFIVFAPFYRLSGDSEGNPECNNATASEILEDVEDALAWVQAEAENYGASMGKVTVMGQSAGAHLSAWLAVHFPQSVERALLLYPPTDFGYLIQQWQDGQLADNEGVTSLESFLGETLATVTLTDPLVINNSYPDIVAANPDSFPPMFIVHGSGDELVPATQASRLCNALSGDVETGPVTMLDTDTSTSRRQVFSCDHLDSEFHSITEAGHMLDICIYPILCPAGDPLSQIAAKGSVEQGYEWSARAVPDPGDSNNNSSDNGGGIVWLLLPLVAFMMRRLLNVNCKVTT